MSKGLLHVHSNFSYDGKNSIEELKFWGKTQNLNFIILTEHDNDFDALKFKKYQDECIKQSSDDLIFIAGIEYSFGSKRHIHISVFGVNEFIKTNNTLEDIPRFLKYVAAQGGLSVLNHPKSITSEVKDIDFSALFGVELWNTKSDFLYSPDPRTNKFIKSKLRNKAIFTTSDIHEIPNKEYAEIVSEEAISNTASVVDLIKNKMFYCIFNKNIIENNFEDIKLNALLLFLAGLHQKTYKSLRQIKRIFGLNVSPKTVKLLKLK